MRKADAAERILSLTTTHEHAASIVGDLMEQAGGRGTLWFWASVLRTMTALGWRTFAQAPGRVIWLAIYGAIIQTLYMLVAIVGVILVTGILVVGARALGMSSERMPGTGIYVMLVEMLLAFAATSILYGKWLARKAPQRELAVYVVFLLLFVAPWAAVLLIWPSTSVLGVGPDMLVNALATILGTTFTFVGVERARKQTAAARLTSSQ